MTRDDILRKEPHMTKLEAWKAWSATAGTDGSEFTLEKSSHGKAFSYAWDAATVAERAACAKLCEDEYPPDPWKPVSAHLEGQFQMAEYMAEKIRARSNT